MEYGTGGRALWQSLGGATLEGPARALAEEACRIKDRLDALDRQLTGDPDVWHHIAIRLDGAAEVVVDKALSEARQQALALANVLKALAAATGTQAPPAPVSATDEIAARRAARRKAVSE